MNTKTHLAAILAALAAAVSATSASAGLLPWPGDPRVCSDYISSAHPKGSTYQQTHCAKHAAALALKAEQGPATINCGPLRKDTTMLRWHCAWGYQNSLPYNVIFTNSTGTPVGPWLVRVKYVGPNYNAP